MKSRDASLFQTKQVMRDLQTAPAMISQYEENEDDPDYVDISDAAVNSDNDRYIINYQFPFTSDAIVERNN